MTNAEIDAAWDSPRPSGHGKSRYDIARDIIADHEVQRQAGQEPVAFQTQNGSFHGVSVAELESYALRGWTPLYTAPQPAAQPVQPEATA